MKFATLSKSLMLGAALLLVSSAFAGTKTTLQLNDTVMVNGTKLKAGEYKVECEGSGANVQVSILKGNKVVANAQAHEVDLQSPSDNTAAVTQKDANGNSSLAGLRFQGKKTGLELTASSNAMSSGSE
jgi:hypothetical protein